jgi:hypothetical protein
MVMFEIDSGLSDASVSDRSFGIRSRTGRWRSAAETFRRPAVAHPRSAVSRAAPAPPGLTLRYLLSKIGRVGRNWRIRSKNTSMSYQSDSGALHPQPDSDGVFDGVTEITYVSARLQGSLRTRSTAHQ